MPREPARRTAASTSAVVSRRRRFRFSASGSWAVQRRARRRPRVSVDQTGPQMVCSTQRVSAGGAGHLDDLAGCARSGPAVRRAVAGGVGRVGLEDHQVDPVARAVGEAPGQLAVAADDEHMGAGQGDAHQAAPAGALGPAQAAAVPDVGQAVGQVHVVGQDGAAVAGERAGHRPVVAAGRVVAGRLASARRRNSCVAHGRRRSSRGRRRCAESGIVMPGTGSVCSGAFQGLLRGSSRSASAGRQIVAHHGLGGLGVGGCRGSGPGTWRAG